MSARARHRLWNVLFAAACLALAIEALGAAFSSGPPSGWFHDLLVVVILALPVCAYFVRPGDRPGLHPGRLLIGIGLALNSIGEGYFFFGERTVTSFPTIGDVFCLAMFPPLVAGIVVLARGGEDRWRLSIGSDAIIVALATGTLAYAVIFQIVLGSAATTLVGGELAYPILDLIVLTLLAVICLPSRFRVGGAYLCLIGGAALLLATDVASLKETSRSGLEPAPLLYFGWGLAVVVLSASSRFASSLPRSEVMRGRLLVFSLGGSMALSLLLLLREATVDQNPVVIAGAAMALVLGLLRLFRSLAENSRLIAELDAVIARQRDMQSELRRLADEDPLTGLANRRRFAEHLDEYLRYARRYGGNGALVFVDLDSFKFINDSFGHAVGDQVLRDVGTAIRASLRSTDIAARLGGDEFAVLLPEIDGEAAAQVAEKLVANVRAMTTPAAGASAGVACFDPAESTAGEDLLIAADLALYEAKAAGRGGVHVYHGRRGMALTGVERIREALREDRLALYGQPIVDIRSGETVREELLIRMIGHDGKEISPESFLPTAERFGLIGEIDHFAVAQAIELARSGRPVAVNVSGPSLTDPTLVESVAAAVHSGLTPHLLSFELTETSAVADVEEARRVADELRSLGCELALDDFGTGVSSLSYLRYLPIQTLKIDTEFIQGMRENAFDRSLVQSIVGLARRLGLKTVAEGVEDEVVLAMLRQFGVDFAQGFLFGRPNPIAHTPVTVSFEASTGR
ncbi:MAG: EAL domain-containing protein [Actinobacteria bacterium]|nr:EAL domain-containing protein [Actinomycetota bacterium]